VPKSQPQDQGLQQAPETVKYWKRSAVPALAVHVHPWALPGFPWIRPEAMRPPTSVAGEGQLCPQLWPIRCPLPTLEEGMVPRLGQPWRGKPPSTLAPRQFSGSTAWLAALPPHPWGHGRSAAPESQQGSLQKVLRPPRRRAPRPGAGASPGQTGSKCPWQQSQRPCGRGLARWWHLA